MGFNWQFVVFFLGLLALTLLLGYLITKALLGPEAARQNLSYGGAWLGIGAIIALLLSFAGRYGLVVLQGLYTLAILAWLLSWPWRKKQAGELLHAVGRTSQNKVLFWLGLVQLGLAIAMTLSILDQITGGLVRAGGIVSGLVEIAFWWSMALLFILLGRSALEIRKNGLCYLYAWQPWERIQAFGWDDDKPNTLILKVQPRTFVSRRYTTFDIPAAQKETVDQLIDDYLVESDLASEMDAPPPAEQV
jgi:hypothetical protein